MKKHTLILLALLALTCYAADPPAPKVERDWYLTVTDVASGKPLAAVNMRTNEVKFYADKDEAMANLAKQFVAMNQQCQQKINELTNPQKAKKGLPKKEDSTVNKDEKTGKKD